MYIGTQGVPYEDESLEALAQLGVNHIAQNPSEPWNEWTTELLVAMREKYDSYGISMEMMHLPLSGRVAIPGNLDNPQNTDALGGVYRVGVHYYRSTRGNFGGEEYGPSMVTIRIYLGGVLADELRQELVDTNDFWDVGGISWGADNRVLRTNRVTEEFPR